MENNPSDPEVFGAYRDMIRQTKAQNETGTSDVKNSNRDTDTGAGRGDREQLVVAPEGTGSALRGVPEKKGATGLLPGLDDVAQNYVRGRGEDYKRQGRYVEVDPAFATYSAKATRSGLFPVEIPNIFSDQSNLTVALKLLFSISETVRR